MKHIFIIEIIQNWSIRIMNKKINVKPSLFSHYFNYNFNIFMFENIFIWFRSLDKDYIKSLHNVFTNMSALGMIACIHVTAEHIRVGHACYRSTPAHHARRSATVGFPVSGRNPRAPRSQSCATWRSHDRNGNGCQQGTRHRPHP